VHTANWRCYRSEQVPSAHEDPIVAAGASLVLLLFSAVLLGSLALIAGFSLSCGVSLAVLSASIVVFGAWGITHRLRPWVLVVLALTVGLFIGASSFVDGDLNPPDSGERRGLTADVSMVD
jgi:hypothetical protein